MCIQQGFCVQGCKTGAKWSTLYTEIPSAEATGKLDLRIECRAMRIEHGANGRVNAVVYQEVKGRSSDRRRAWWRCGQWHRDAATVAAFGVRKVSAGAREFFGPGGAELLSPDRRLHMGDFRQARLFLAGSDGWQA